ncbi:hypothetical protein E6H31_04815 [Candidatus Bathyarchaeota archaeon]|nr:MAG: hypothetical protein E6H31_04815 [Candidatus Bathyarchaeota archaeon]
MGVLAMGMYRRFVHAKKGMSTVFGGLFFVILILMGFNLMTWNFLQYDAYNGVVTSMSQRDQLSSSENIQAIAPGATGFAGNSFNVTVTNLGGITTTLSRIYIQNVSPTGTLPLQCRGASLCTVDSGSGTINCAGNGNCGFTSANIRPGENNHVMKVTGLTINDGSGYQVIMSSTRGRQFSFFYPWPVNGFGGSNSNATNTAHGALDVKFDLNSFNFTRGTQTVSVPGWTVPYATPLVYWVKVVNNAVNPITISQYTSLYFVCYQDRFGSGNGTCNETDLNFVVDNRTMNPNTLMAYDDVNRPYVLPGAGPNGPTGNTIIKFGSFCPGATCGNPPPNQDVDFPTPYLVFMGFFYKINGQIVGQTISFVAVRACTTYPSCP